MIHPPKHCGFMLLEVVVAVGLLVLGMALVGAQMQGSLERTRETELSAKAVFLAESRLAEIDTGLVIPKLNEPVEEDFGRLFPWWASRVSIVPLVDRNAPAVAEPDPKNLGLLYIEMQILYDPRRNMDEDFDFDGAEVVASYHTLRAAPRPLNLIKDFGMDEQAATQLNENLLGSGFDFSAEEFNPDTFRNLGPEELAALLPTLMDAFGGQLSDILGALPSDIRTQLQALLDSQAAENPDTSSGDDASNPSGAGSPDGGGAAGGRGAGSQDDSGAENSGDVGDDANANANANDNAGSDRSGGNGRRGGGRRRGGGGGRRP